MEPLTADQIKAKNYRERKRYSHGMSHTLMALRSLVDRGLSFEEAYRILIYFLEKEILEWANQEDFSIEIPEPRIDVGDNGEVYVLVLDMYGNITKQAIVGKVRPKF